MAPPGGAHTPPKFGPLRRYFTPILMTLPGATQACEVWKCPVLAKELEPLMGLVWVSYKRVNYLSLFGDQSATSQHKIKFTTFGVVLELHNIPPLRKADVLACCRGSVPAGRDLR